ncbi:MAG: polysaccharide biosynthesis/export family protein [Acidobacteria bacterium]|nr:polysaccharide biosynthesis/export family protein [Acidobacteriota bacterium]
MFPILLSLLLLCSPATQELAAQQVKETQTKDVRQDYRVGPGDTMSIRVLGLSEFDQTIRVSNSGKIHVPHLGILRVAGMTTSQIGSEIGNRLTEQQLVKEPWVQVYIAEYRAHPVFVLGEVMQPGQFMIQDEMRVMDLISLTAGLNEVASPIGYLYRRNVESHDVSDKDAVQKPIADEAIEINFQQLYDGSRPELNMKLVGGDVLYVPQRKEAFLFVVGDVYRSGAIKIPFGQQVLATQAIARAGGPTKTAKMSKGMLMRYDQNGERQELATDFKAILEGKKPDFPLVANDIIFIPGSSAKTLAYGFLNIIPRIAQTALIIP